MAIDSFSRAFLPREVGMIENVSELLEALARTGSDTDRQVCFRGHASAEWIAVPSILRDDNEGMLSSENLAIREIVSRFPDHFIHDKTMFDRLVRMQHFGLPTRLLDVTGNPLVALYFAISEKDHDDSDGSLVIFSVENRLIKYYDSDSVSCVCNLANLSRHEKNILEETTASKISDFRRLNPAQRLYQFIREEKPYFKERIKKEDLLNQYYVVPKRSNARIVAQNGNYILDVDI